MPDEFGRLAQVVVDRIPGIVIAIAAGKDNNAKFHELEVLGRLHFSLADAVIIPRTPGRVRAAACVRAALRVSDAARSNSARASSKRPSLASRSPRTLGRR